MKYVLSLGIIIFLSGCVGGTKLILVPQVQYYPIFNTSNFKPSEKYKLKIWQEEDANGTYIVSNKQDALDFYKDTKILRTNYNLLLKKINDFNIRVEELNKKQAELKLQEIK